MQPQGSTNVSAFFYVQAAAALQYVVITDLMLLHGSRTPPNYYVHVYTAISLCAT